MTTTAKPQAPSHYSTIQIGKALHQVPAHIVTSIVNMVQPYDEFKEVLSASPETVKAQELAADRNTELIEARLKVEELEAKLAEFKGVKETGEDSATSGQSEAPLETEAQPGTGGAGPTVPSPGGGE